MSSDHPSDAPSPGRNPDTDLELARVVRDRGSALVDALEAAAPGSGEHGEAVASYAFAVAVELGHGRARAELIREAARLHEIGEAYGGDHRAGAQLARGAGVPDVACKWIAATGERFDGRGPDRLAGDQIPLEARILRAACAGDRCGADPSALRAEAGGELDPRVADALATVLERVSDRSS